MPEVLSNSLPDVVDPELLAHPLLRTYWLSERRVILLYQTRLCDRCGSGVTLEEAIVHWESGPCDGWRARKAERDCARQCREIERHKYYLSQRMGYDVGEELAAVDWVKHHAKDWRTWWEEQSEAGPSPELP